MAQGIPLVVAPTPKPFPPKGALRPKGTVPPRVLSTKWIPCLPSSPARKPSPRGPLPTTRPSRPLPTTDFSLYRHPEALAPPSAVRHSRFVRPHPTEGGFHPRLCLGFLPMNVGFLPSECSDFSLLQLSVDCEQSQIESLKKPSKTPQKCPKTLKNRKIMPKNVQKMSVFCA